MALFTDSNVITLDDLLLFESTLVQVSSTHSIDVQTKINLAIDGIGDQLLLFVLRSGYFNGQTALQVNSALSHVFVSPAIRRWLCFDALTRIYEEAYNVQLNTRFQGKMSEYQQQAAQARQLAYSSSLGMVSAPLARPAMPSIVVTPGTYGGAAVFAQTSWVDRNGCESELSPINASVLSGFSSVQISPVPASSSIPSAATGWNVYLSESQQGLTRQNSQELLLGQSWILPVSGIFSGPSWTGAQTPNLMVSLSTRLLRG